MFNYEKYIEIYIILIINTPTEPNKKQNRIRTRYNELFVK